MLAEIADMYEYNSMVLEPSFYLSIKYSCQTSFNLLLYSIQS